MTIWDTYIKGFKDYLMLERSLSTHSISAYIGDTNKLVDYLAIHGISLGPLELKREHFEDFLKWLNELGLGESTQGRILSGVKAFYKYLLMEDIIDDDPIAQIEGPKLNRKIPSVLTVEEVNAILSNIDLSHPQGTRNRAILEMLYACGVRVSELTNLKLSNLFLDIGFIKIIGKNNKERIVPIGEEAIKHLQYYLLERKKIKNIPKEYENIVFLNRRGKQLTRVMIFYVVKNSVARAGIEKIVSPHTFRHSFATHLIEGGADLRAIQDMLGHESITTTEIYTHLDMDYLKETIISYHPRNQQKRQTAKTQLYRETQTKEESEE